MKNKLKIESEMKAQMLGTDIIEEIINLHYKLKVLELQFINSQEPNKRLITDIKKLPPTEDQAYCYVTEKFPHLKIVCITDD